MGERELEWSNWMRAALAGDAAAYNHLLHSVATVLRSIVQRQLTRAGKGNAELEDIVQEILLAIHLKRASWDTARPIGPWINAIARYKTIDALRRRGGRLDLPIDLFTDVLPAPEESPRISERDLERSLAALTPTQRSVVTSIALDGMSIADTASRLDMTEGAVRVTLHRGLVTLAKAAAQAEIK